MKAKTRKRQSKATAASAERPSLADAPVSPDAKGHKVKPAVLVLTVFACALSLRLLFVHEVLLQSSCLYGDLNAAPKAGFLAPLDSEAYISLARNFFGSYFGAQAGDKALWRTPGYPAFLIPFYSLGLAPAGILYAQAFISALIPVLTMLLAQLLTGSMVLAGLAGLLSMASPTGVGLSGLIMNDLFMAFIVALGVNLLFWGTIRESASWLITAGALFGVGFLVKPILMLWPLCMIALHYAICVAEGKSPRWKALAVAMAIQFLILGIWCTRNYVYEKVFSPSSNVNFAIHDYLRPRVEEWVKAGRLPATQAVLRNRDETRVKLEQDMAGRPLVERLNLMKTRSMEVLRAHPWVTLQVLFQDMKEHAFAGWDYFHLQLPLGVEQLERLMRAKRLESTFREKVCVVSAGFFVVLLIAMVVRPTAAKRRVLILTFVLILIYGYFSVFSGTAFRGGSRVMYPVEFVMILLVVMMLQAVGTACCKMLEGARLFSADAAPVRALLHRYRPWITVLMTLAVGLYGTWMIIGRDSGTYDNLGRALANRGNLGDSVPFFEQAVQHDPTNLQAKHDLALAHVRLEQYGKAVPLLREVLHGRPGDADSHYLLGVALFKGGMLQESQKHLQEALRLNPGHENARKSLNALANP